MENEITAHKSGVISQLSVAVGAAVSTGDTLAVISSD
jgi:biotin carboxyl carrier protein